MTIQLAGLPEVAMSFWDGTRWVPEEQTAAPTGSRRTTWAATLVMVLGLVALVVPFSSTAASSQKSVAGCSVSPAAVGVNAVYPVSAWGLPTRGVINLWVTENGVATGSPLGGTTDGTFNLSRSSSSAGTTTYAFSGPTKGQMTVYATCSVTAN
jgi:hypothetical protein